MKTEDMPALPEPAVWRARGQIWSLAELHRQGLIDEADGLFSAEQVISYAAQAVAAERERWAADARLAAYVRERAEERADGWRIDVWIIGAPSLETIDDVLRA